jgi:hypothetical protein
MRYPDGQPVMLGDRVRYGTTGTLGRVVGIVDAGEFAHGYPSSEWSYLEEGVLVESDQFGLIHYQSELDADVELDSRESPGSESESGTP